MTVYELIQELARYESDTEVVFHVYANFDADGTAEFDRDNENDCQDVSIEAEFDDDVEFDDIEDNEHAKYTSPNITINLKY